MAWHGKVGSADKPCLKWRRLYTKEASYCWAIYAASLPLKMLPWKIWLLVSVAFAIAFSLLTYVAIFKLAVLRKLLAFGLRRALRTVCEDKEGTASTYRVTSDQSGNSKPHIYICT